ncbi:MAG TPA: hypothetical protein VFA50_15070 [Stellaceae bacterium]|nr:hypothetical protein [Stellaceae bacterium]
MMAALQFLCTAIGAIILFAICLFFAVALVINVWRWLTEQIWEAGERVRDRRRRKALANAQASTD